MNRGARWLLVAAFELAAMWGPGSARAQVIASNLARRTVEVGFAREWFRRELEPAAFQDTEWNVTSLGLRYGAFEWLTVGFQGGLSSFEHPDFAGSDYRRYAVGVCGTGRVYRNGAWELTLGARYLDTWDRDKSDQSFHKRARRFGVEADLVRRFHLLDQETAMWVGPMYADDRIENYPWGVHEPLPTQGDSAWGAAAGVHILLRGYVAVFGYACYLDRFQGGVGVSLHAGGGGL